MIGQSLGRYHILEQLGEGGMATVYKAFDTHVEREVAIKFIRSEKLKDQKADTVLKRFKREAQALAKLSHPNILTVLDYGEHEGQLYLVTEYLPGGSLKQELGKPMPWAEAAKLLTPIARALEYAHSQRILHRDVKPANILLSPSGLPVLADFGIAKLLEGEETTELTRADVGIGTPDYMAPEQGKGKADHRSDVYSLGVVFYELVTGRKPYTADTPLAVLMMHATDPLPRPKQFVRDLPDSVERVIFKALAKKPEDRFQDVATFAVALENLAQRRKISLGRVSRVSDADFRRLRALVGLIAIGVGTLIVGGVLVANGRGGKFAVGRQTVISVVTKISATPAVTLVTATSPPTLTPTLTPTLPKPTPTIDADPLMYDNFNNSENDGEFNATRWVRNRDSDNGVKIFQQDGYLSLSTSGLEEQEWGGLVARDYEGFTIDKPAFFEADLMLNKGGTGGNVAFGFWADTDGGWEIDCGVRASSPISYPAATCAEYVQGTSQFNYSTNSVSAEYDTWHRLRVEIDPTTMTFSYFSDDILIGTHTPSMPSDLGAQLFPSR